MIISNILSRFRNPHISVELDPALLPHLSCHDLVSLQRRIPINLYRMVLMIGTVQTRRFWGTKRMKFSDKSDMLEKLHLDNEEFRVRISDIQDQLGPEVLTTMSEDFGVGISIMIAAHLFNIRESTVERIRDTRKRPDWQCQTRDNRLLVVESKGASSEATSAGQRQNAINQKRTRQGDIRVASLTVIRENEISTNSFIDPPINSQDMDPEQQRHLLRAGHYASVFNFLGHVPLSRYFVQMRKRIEDTITKREQLEKDSMFFNIRKRYDQVNYLGDTFAGTFYEITNNQYLFVGVNIDLVSYDGFLKFNEYAEDNDEEIDENHYIRFKDGVLMIEITNIQVFSDIVDVSKIRNYQESITISDVDTMTEISFEKYWLFLLNRIGFRTESEVRFSDSTIDIVAENEGRRYIFELKLYQRPKYQSSLLDRNLENLRTVDAYRAILVTNSYLPESSPNNKLVLIGREKLIEILRRPERLLELLT